jgi:electron transfer flavoprotein alpha subunit
MPDEIVVFAEQQAGKLVRPAWEAVAAAQRLAHDMGLGLTAVVVGSRAETAAAEIAAAELGEVLTVESPQLESYTPDAYTLTLRQLLIQRRPRLAAFSHTYQVRDFVPKLAASLNCAFVSDCLSYRIEESKLILVRQVFQGKFNADVEFTGDPPYLVSFQAGSFRQDSVSRGASPARIGTFPVTIDPQMVRTRPGERFREARQAVDLSQAEIIVAVGRGIKSQEHVELARKLAEVLGAELGASRPICDNGWLPMDRQIGSSGQTVAPKLYLALGISGAIQHQVGMKGSRTVVAINKDREAPIFEIATYGVVGDLFEIVPPLIEEIRAIKSA